METASNTDSQTTVGLGSTASLGSVVLMCHEEPPHTKNIEWCANHGCAYNGAFSAEKGRCTSTSGQCYGYMPNAMMCREGREDGQHAPKT